MSDQEDLLWCVGTQECNYQDTGFATKADALEFALSENEEAETIYLAQYELEQDLELPLFVDIPELLCQFQENQSLDETWEPAFEALAPILEKRLEPHFERLQREFRDCLREQNIELLDITNEQELSREEAERIVRDAEEGRAKAILAIGQAKEALQWIEAYLRNPNLKDEADNATNRMGSALDAALEAITKAEETAP